MDQYRSPVALQPQQANLKPEGKKLRRKLQKIPNNTKRNSISYANSISSNAKPESRGFRWSAFGKKSDSAKSSSQVTSEQLLDLSDPKWNDYLRTSRYEAQDVHFVPQPHVPELPATPVTTSIVPEFAHLKVTNDTPHNLSETASTDGLYSPESNSSTSSGSRRKAKTPVTRIGQLEESALTRADSTKKADNIEHIAESYRALVETPADHEERFMTPFQYFEQLPAEIGIRKWEAPPMPDSAVKTIIDLPRPSKQDTGSPTSSDGTLVGFEEDAIYFKPISLLTDPPSSPRVLHMAEVTQPSSMEQSVVSLLPENPTLQIISDLLTKELSNTLRPNGETSSLQVWLMIEAYEKLKEKLEGMNLAADQAQSVQMMFNMWLTTLHTIHDSLTGHDGHHSESDYGE